MKQAEIVIPAPIATKNYWKEHVCKKYKKERRNLVYMVQGIDERFFIGTCSQCGEGIVEKWLLNDR